MKVSEFLMYLGLVLIVVLLVMQLQKPVEETVVYLPSRFGGRGYGPAFGYESRPGYGWGGYGWGGRGGYGWGGRGGYGGRGGRGGRGGFGGGI